MANKITETRLTADAFVDFTSRYSTSKVIYYGDNNIITFETYKRNPIISGSKDRFYLITDATQYRPDLVSYKAYGVSSYWWKIMEANNMKDISDFKSGLTIKIPENLF